MLTRLSLAAAATVLASAVPVSAQALAVSASLVGDIEVVMDYRRDTCRAAGGMDLPDVQARAFRRADGSIGLVSGNAPVNYFMFGPDFDRLTRRCVPVLSSGRHPDAQSFDNQEWVASVYREGSRIHALVHNEYHDPGAPNCKPGVDDPANPCWYNALTYAWSDDDGQTFQHAPPPHHVLAAPPTPWNPSVLPDDRGRGPAAPTYGYFAPSNIVRGPDGAYYSMFLALPDPANHAAGGTCLMRTETLGDPASWRAWDGAGFGLAMPSPYDAKGLPTGATTPACAVVGRGTLGPLHGSLTFNTYLDRYLLVGEGMQQEGTATVCGTWFSLSSDLLTWTRPQLLKEGPLPWAPCTGGGDGPHAEVYGSIIDHGATDANFTLSGQEPYLYYVRWVEGLHRDLVRQRVRFER